MNHSSTELRHFTQKNKGLLVAIFLGLMLFLVIAVAPSAFATKYFHNKQTVERIEDLPDCPPGATLEKPIYNETDSHGNMVKIWCKGGSYQMQYINAKGDIVYTGKCIFPGGQNLIRKLVAYDIIVYDNGTEVKGNSTIIGTSWRNFDAEHKTQSGSAIMKNDLEWIYLAKSNKLTRATTLHNGTWVNGTYHIDEKHIIIGNRTVIPAPTSADGLLALATPSGVSSETNTPKSEYVLYTPVPVTGFDEQGKLTTVTFAQPAGSQNLIFTPIVARENEMFTFQVNYMDENWAQRYSFVNSPTGMTIDPISGLIQWIPVASQLGNNDVDLKTTFLDGTTDLQEFNIPVITTVTIPSWIKNTAGWWSSGEISQGEFVTAIGYLTAHGVINVQSRATADSIVNVNEQAEIPSWIKNDASWWSKGIISDSEFVQGIQYMLDNNVITFSKHAENNPSVNMNSEVKLKVVDANSNEGLDAVIEISGNSKYIQQSTDRNGQIDLFLPDGQYTIQIDSSNYQRLVDILQVSGDTQRTFQLEPFNQESQTSQPKPEAPSQPQSTQPPSQGSSPHVSANPGSLTFVHNIGMTSCPEVIGQVNLQSDQQGTWTVLSNPSWTSVTIQNNVASIDFNCQLSQYVTQTLSGTAEFLFSGSSATGSTSVQITGQVNAQNMICLSADTKIETPNGEINVKDVHDGTIVYSVDSSHNKIQSKVIKINHVFVGNAHKVIDLKLADGRELFVSANHPTYDNRAIASIKIGEIYDGSKVTAVNLIPYKYQYTYDILPESPTGMYYANEILLGSTLK